VANLAVAFLKLSSEDFSIMSSIEAGMRDHEWVPPLHIARLSGLPVRKVDYRLRILEDMGLVFRETIHYVGYQIDFNGYDLLALAELVKRGFVGCIGDKVGVGKESVVFEALNDTPLIIKFHRQGRTSFKHVRRARSLFKDLPRSSWLHAATIAAKHEFRIMKRLYPIVSIPKPVALSKHAVTMELVMGSQINRVVLTNPQDCLDVILDEVHKAFLLGIVHADLSEFNILIDAESIKIIDWPQAVDVNHSSAQELLEHDISNILKFFERKYRIMMKLDDALCRVRDSIREVSL
jgi:RIO kinase 2